MTKITGLPVDSSPSASDYIPTVDMTDTTTKRALLSDVLLLDRPHVSGLLFNLDNGVVFSNTQITCAYDTVYSGEYGLTATTGASSKITVARNGLYQITMHFRCIDVTASAFITWLYHNRSGTVTAFRRCDQSIAVGLGWTWSFTIPLLAGDFIYQQIYNGSGATRFGTANSATQASETARIMGMSLMMTEIR